ncbi:MAG: aspartate aminotransferase family protein [Acidimicrobiia bacterium]
MTTATDRYSFVPGAASVPTIVGGTGSWLHTADGGRILDAAGGAIVGNIGWGRDEVRDAVAAGMDHAAYSIPLWPTPHRMALLDEMIEHWLPDGFDRVFLTSGGSESTDSALRLARAYQVANGRPERWKIVGRHPSYHGMTLATMAAASHTGRQKGFEPMLLTFPKVAWDDPADVVAVIEREDPDTIAGFIAEPMTGAAGACLTADDEYWRTVTEICKAHDILLIADEVMTGYGRTGLTWGHQHFPFEPDVVVGGKGLGGGYVPIGAVATRSDIAEVLRHAGFMFFTFTGNDTASIAALEVLRIMRRESLVDRSAQMGKVLGDKLHGAFDAHPAVVEVRGRGLFYGIELAVSKERVVAEALARGVWVYPAGSGPVSDAVIIAPPFVVTDSEIDRIVEEVGEAISAVSS